MIRATSLRLTSAILAMSAILGAPASCRRMEHLAFTTNVWSAGILPAFVLRFSGGRLFKFRSMLMFHWPARCRRSSKMRIAGLTF
jgi:hypothetical protein